MIEVAVILSAVAGRWEDFAVIFVMLLINGGVGYWHESKASSAIEALKDKLAPESIVIRNGNRKLLLSSNKKSICFKLRQPFLNVLKMGTLPVNFPTSGTLPELIVIAERIWRQLIL